MNCIVNVTENWGIGLENELLVSISADLKRFRQLTTGQTVILGRKTLSTFPGGKPLKNRDNLVLSTNAALDIPGAVVCHDLDSLLDRCRAIPQENLWVIGGASIYELLLPYCRTAEVTKTFAAPAADRFFPNLDQLPNWRVVKQSEVFEEDGVRFQYVTYENSTPKGL